MVVKLMKRIQVIDDEAFICKTLKEGLTDIGYEVKTSLTGENGLRKIESFKPLIVFLDMRLERVNGIDLIERIKKIDEDIEVVIMTAFGDIETAVKAIKNGAFDYINKPLDLEEINLIIAKALKSIEVKRKLNSYVKEKKLKDEAIIGNNPVMKEVFEKINIIAKNDVTVLIRGQTGTGKEMVANSIHKKSNRRDSSMLSINCGALPKELVESELFGFEKNAFTGAFKRKKGLLEIADGGTVLLDEIGELSYDTQTKLLRVLETRKFKRIGGVDDIEVDIRIIAATNKNLEKAIENNEFREDLFYRLNVVPIKIPSLKDRGGDVLILAKYFLNKYNKKFGKEIKGFDDEVKDKLLNYHWPGNVRELKNVIERITILHDTPFINLNHLPLEINKPLGEKTKDNEVKVSINESFSLEKEVEKLEKKYIKIALDKCNNNYSKSASLLGISRFALKRRIEKYF
ncbi:MAG: sigma-54-dependent Fis family transcriptional regulator [Firmicutes bacterium]|nr:sigma-54-dependent Fis family transcriptional regulator [Bacillota bacterium]